MRYAIILLFCFCCHAASGRETSPKDSLLNQLTQTTESGCKAQIYRNLADLEFDSPQERLYLKRLIEEATASKDNSLLLSAYTDLAASYIKAEEVDSARLQIGQIKQMPVTNATQCQLSCLNIRLFNSKVVKGGGAEAINEELRKQVSSNDTEKNIFARIEHAYNIASALETQKKYSAALPYITTAVELAATLPFEETGPLYIATIRLQQRLLQLNDQYSLVIPAIEKYIALQEEYYQKYLKKSRPFYPIDGFRLSGYTLLIVNIRHLTPEKADFYLQKIIDLSNKSSRPLDKYRGFLSINNYYLFKRDYRQALISNDSVIRYASVVAPYALSNLHNVSSQIHEAMGDFGAALTSLKTSHQYQDSLVSSQSAEQLNELQVQYGLDKLNYEKAKLEVKNKLIMLISLSIFLIISLLTSVYLYRSLRKEKAMKAHLRILKNQAEESEKMKTAFINSICHEIRTPLNSIVGFSNLILEPGIDEQTKQTFPEEIQKNADELTNLIDRMLEVSNLDVSDQKLPCAPADISALCMREMAITQANAVNPAVHYHLQLPERSSYILTHERYLALVVENLLSNANKFTTTGDITLEYHEDKEAGTLQLSVTDTGCGIPRERQRAVFERFVKFDAFVPGNGLGLYLCQLIVVRLSGEIAIDPDYTSGTRVCVSLPLNEA